MSNKETVFFPAQYSFCNPGKQLFFLATEWLQGVHSVFCATEVRAWVIHPVEKGVSEVDSAFCQKNIKTIVSTWHESGLLWGKEDFMDKMHCIVTLFHYESMYFIAQNEICLQKLVLFGM